MEHFISSRSLSSRWHQSVKHGFTHGQTISNLTPVLLWGLSREQRFLVHVFSLKAVLDFLFWYVSSSVAVIFSLRQSAIRTRTVPVPYDDSKSAKRNEAHPIYKTGSAS
jgi:hypothetical protein